MNITFVTPGMGYGGAERVISILSNQWTLMGHNVAILIVGENSDCVYSLDDRVKIQNVGNLNGKPIIAHMKLIKNIKKVMFSLNTDIAVSFMNDTCAFTALALKHTKIPVFYSERNDPTRVNQRKIDKLYRKIVERYSKGFVFQTEGAKLHYKKSVQDKSTVILNPFNAENLPFYDFEKRNKEIVSVGRLQPQKNQKLLIDAFSLIANDFTDYKLKIYGDGQLREELQKQIVDYGLTEQIILMGAHKDIFNKISTASLFVLSSDFEGLPNTLIEAMCIGIPSVSTDCSPGGARELIVDGKNGIIVPRNDKCALADAIRKVLSDEKLAKKISEECKKVSERMKCEKISKQWLDFFDKYM